MNKQITILQQIIEKNLNFYTKEKDSCILCGTKENITKEHLLPKWTFEKDIKKSFYISPDDTLYSYRLSYLPCCKNCNCHILGNFEQCIKELFNRKEKEYSLEEKKDIIFWIKYLDFKFKVFGIEKACHSSKKNKSHSGLFNREKNNHSDFIKELLREIENSDSLIISEANQKNFDFFYWKNHYFSMTLPQCNISIFYFFTNKIENIENFCKEML